MARIVLLDHVQLAMPPGEEPRARAFYTGVLGLPELPKPPVLAARGGVWFEGPGAKVHLGVEKDFRPAKKAHPGLVVDELEVLVAELRAAGVTITPDDSGLDLLRYYVEDPFGNRLELIQMASGA
jgi:catechol 2,3-dioxygenase-like lactoylglutathione lyase family enzyme